MTRLWLALALTGCGHATTLSAQLTIIAPLVEAKAGACPKEPIELKRSPAPDVVIETLPPISEYEWQLHVCGRDERVVLDCVEERGRHRCSVDAAGSTSAFDVDLETFRLARGKPWGPDQQRAVEAAGRIFSGIDWVGRPRSEVQAALGEPDEVAGPRWTYTRHNGESGVIRVLVFDGEKVAKVEAVPTQ